MTFLKLEWTLSTALVVYIIFEWHYHNQIVVQHVQSSVSRHLQHQNNETTDFENCQKQHVQRLEKKHRRTFHISADFLIVLTWNIAQCISNKMNNTALNNYRWKIAFAPSSRPETPSIEMKRHLRHHVLSVHQILASSDFRFCLI